MNYNNLKIYCKTEEDQSAVFDFLFYEYRNEIKYSTWEPDGDTEDDGTWGMFIDDFPLELWDKLTDWLESEDSWVLDEEVDMALECESPRAYRYYGEA